MGSLENGLPVKRDSSLNRLSSRSERNSFSQRPRSRFARFVLFKKIDYLQWVCTVAVFLFFVVLFQMFLPGSVTEKSGNLLTQDRQVFDGDLSFLKEMGGLDFGQDIKFEPSKILAKFQKVDREGNGSYGVSKGLRFGYRKPQLAMVFADLLVDPQQIMMVTIAAALREIGYDIKVHSMEDGPAHSVWRTLGVPVNIIQSTEKRNIAVDWLNYDGVLINNLEARRVIASLLQEPFKSIPLIWTIHESTLAIRLRQYLSNGQIEFVDNWKRVFARATVVVYPNHVLPMLYSPCDTGNYFVIPGSPAEAWEVDHFMGSHQDSVREKMNFGSDDLVIAIAGSQLVYGGMWLEHALILQATLPLLAGFPSRNNSKTGIKVIVLSGDSTRNYTVAVEMIAMKLKYPTGTVKHIAIGEDVDGVLSMVDLVVYGSFFEDQSFPDILKRAMCFEKPIIAPDHAMIKKYVDDRVNGYLYSKDNIKAVTQIMMQVIVNGKLSPLARNVASIGKHTAKNMMVSESIEGYSSLLENVLQFPSEVALPKAISVIPQNLKEEWQWHRFESIADQTYRNRTLMGYTYLDELEKKWNNSYGESSGNTTTTSETFIYSIWEEEKTMQMINIRKRREDDELKDRTDQPRGTWDDVYRNAKKADRLKNELHERDDGELERTGQPLSIYEPYLGEGAWPFLHHRSLYRGLGLSSKGRRSGADDVDAPSRLPLLNNPYYRDVLGEYGAYLAIANRIDRIHKNAWIGFQSWRATARKESLSKAAESALLNDIETRRHGDALYFWVRMDKDPRNPLQQEFWSFCDAINAGNCRTAFSKTLVKMYGIKHDIGSLPPMPTDGDTWSVMHSWALPTRSFLEFVMFSRMFVDSLDSQFYEAHHQSGYCYLSLSKDKHCYSRLLELLINVWAYHSARRMIYINPNTGLMQEHHVLKSRRGQMWVKWFQNSMLKGMDEDLAEEADTDPKRRWLWPSTGEVFWKGMYEKERSQRSRDKEKRKQQSKDKIDRIKRRTHQKTIGRYMKPPPLKVDNLNTTVVDV